MSMHHDPELDDILQDAELKQVADLLRAGRMTEDPPLDDAFRSALRRQLMNRAWGMGGSTVPWWRKAFGPAGLAWAGAAMGVILIAAAVVFTALTSGSTGSLTRDVLVTSPMHDQSAVRLQQPILVNFNQPMDHPSPDSAVQITPATTGAAAGGTINTLVPDGVTSAAVAPAGDRLAYIRNGKIEVLGLVASDTVEIAPIPAPTRVGWTKDGVVWTAVDGVYALGANGPIKLASLPTTSTIDVLSFSPDGAHLAYTQEQSLYVFDVATGTRIVLGLPPALLLR